MTLLHLHQRLAARFARPEPRRHGWLSLQAVISDIPRKNGWQIAEHAKQERPYGMQRLLSRAVWDEEGVRDDLRTFLWHCLSPPPLLSQRAEPEALFPVLIIDESGLPKRGSHWAGVQKQYCRASGHVENCQVGVFLSYVTALGHALLDRELYLPEDWCHDPARRRAAHMPETLTFQTKPELAQRMVHRAQSAGLPIGWVVADTVDGHRLDWRLWLEEQGFSSAVAIPCTEGVCVQTQEGCLLSDMATIAHHALSTQDWQRLSQSQGTKGQRLFDWALLPLWQRGAVDGRHWLVIGRCLDEPNELATALPTMVQALGAGFQIELVPPHMTKTKMLTGLGGGDHRAHLHLLVGHDDAIKQPLDQLPFLLKGGLSKSLRYWLAKGFHGWYHTCQCIVSSATAFQLACLLSKALLSWFQFEPPPLVCFQRKHSSQIGIGQSCCLLSQAHTSGCRTFSRRAWNSGGSHCPPWAPCNASAIG